MKRPELAATLSSQQQALFDTGREVGNLATALFPGNAHVRVDAESYEQAMQITRSAVGDPHIDVIYEGAFHYDNVRVRVDILTRTRDGNWNLIEVKSSTRVKEQHIPDVGTQVHVLRGSGVAINRVFLVHLNNQYVYDGGDLALAQLFTSSDLTREALAEQEKIPQRLDELKEMLARRDPPEVLPSRNCRKPYPCEFWEHCKEDMPEHPIWELAVISQKKLDFLSAKGIVDIRDIPDSFSLSEVQERIRRCVITSEEYIDSDLGRELEEIVFPAHFLDFETLGPAIPRYAGSRPYQAIPFQWSDHILLANGSIEHRDFLHGENDDPREEFTKTLLEVLERKGCIFTYTGFEEGAIRALAEHLPQQRDRLLAILNRIKDLQRIVSKRYYHPGFHGSFSLKAVLPALLPDMGYENLAIQDGQQAGIEYLRMMRPSTAPEEKERIRGELLRYCGHDTLAMVKIREELLKRARRRSVALHGC